MDARIAATAVAVVAVLALTAGAGATTGATAPKPVAISITVKKGRPVGGVARPTVKKGKLVRIVVRTDAGSEVHLHGYDIERKVVPGRPVVMLFRAKIPGRFDLELHHPDILLANLTVR